MQAPVQATSTSRLGQQCDSACERKNDSSNISFTENCEDPASWPKRLSTAHRDLLIAKGPYKLDWNNEFPKDVTDRKFSNGYLQRKLSNGEVMQRKWLVYSVGKIGHFACVASFFPIGGFSHWSNASLRLAEHETSSCHLQFNGLKLSERK